MNMQDHLQLFWDSMSAAGQYILHDLEKPVLVAVPEVAYPMPRAKAWKIFVDAGLPVFRNIMEAVTALEKVNSYYETRKRRRTT
jgi:hypothetical protein